MFAESRCITMRHVIMDVADGCATIDLNELATSLDPARHQRGDGPVRPHERGRCRWQPSPLPRRWIGFHNPGIELHWEGKPGEGGFPLVDVDEPDIHERILKTAAGTEG